MTDHVADGTGVDHGSIALRLLRRCLTEAGTPIAPFNWHPADMFTYVMHVHSSEPEHGRKRPGLPQAELSQARNRIAAKLLDDGPRRSIPLDVRMD